HAFLIIGSTRGIAAKEAAWGLQHSAHPPRPQPFLQLLGIRGRIGGGLYCLRNNDSRGLVLPVPRMHAAPLIDDDVRAKRANDSHQVFLAHSVPYLQSFLGALRIAEIRGAREK